MSTIDVCPLSMQVSTVRRSMHVNDSTYHKLSQLLCQACLSHTLDHWYQVLGYQQWLLYIDNLYWSRSAVCQ